MHNAGRNVVPIIVHNSIVGIIKQMSISLQMG
jgi:hypothetical protein